MSPNRTARTSWVIWFCICLHIWWGILLLLDPDARGVTAINLATRVFGSTQLAAVVFIAAGIAAAVGVFRARPNTLSGLLELLPQQGLLILSAFGAVMAVYHGAYADAEPRPRAFIAADQAPAVFIMLAHSASLFDHFTPRAR